MYYKLKQYPSFEVVILLNIFVFLFYFAFNPLFLDLCQRYSFDIFFLLLNETMQLFKWYISI